MTTPRWEYTAIIVDESKATFYRHPIHMFDSMALEDREKWTTWMPAHFKRICLVINELPPDVHFEVSQESELGESSLSGTPSCLQLIPMHSLS
jgi:hypothetical protein